jgi:outer membrane protein assembly factor BamB
MKNKKILVTALILVLAISSTVMTMPASNAQATGKKVTYPFIGAIPNPVGVGQEVLLHIGITDPTNILTEGFTGLTVTLTKPDGTSQTLGPFTTDSTGGTGTVFIPSMTGNYTLQTHFPEQTIPSATRFIPAGTTMEASDSEKLTLIVQEEPIAYYPGQPLPTEYWTRPIDSQLREWSPIAGNWLTAGREYNPINNDAPETAHILWSKPLSTGGLAGGELDDHGYFTGDAYQGRFGASVIINGVLYYNRFNSGFASSPVQQGIIAVDLHTGEQVWFRNNTRLAFGQTFYWDSFNSHGVYAYVWETVGTTWRAYDAFTGEWVYTMTDVPSGTQIYGPKGEILRFTVNTQGGWMTMWNSTRVAQGVGFNVGSWAPERQTFNATRGIQYNVTIPAGLPGVVNKVLPDRIIGSDVPAWTGLANKPITFWALNTQPGFEGQQIYKTTWNPPAGNLTMLPGPASSEEGLFIVTAKELRAFYGFDISTGQQLWGPTTTQPYPDMYVLGEERAIARSVVIAEGKVFSSGVGGVLHCYDAKTGSLLWTYEFVDEYSEILWANNWWLNIMFVTDGKIYLGHDEHSPINPLPRGAPFICIDTKTGEKVWSIDGAFRQTQWGGSAIIGDSIIATMDTYDMKIYAIGKGPTATTVTVPNFGVMIGSSVVITGMVTDISPGTIDSGIKMRFPNGVPAVSDESMSAWMLYVYKQFPRPMDAIGVEVMIDVVDANGNYRNIGSTTSDADGFFSFSWTPDIEGKYTVYASFGGSKAYWPSHAVTAFNIDPAPTHEPTQPPQQSMADMYLLPGIAVIIIVIVIIGALIILILRKRP